MQEERRGIKEMLRDPRPIAGGADDPDPKDPKNPDPKDPDPKDPDPSTDKDTDHEAEAKKWKALARKHEAQAKANADAAKKLKELEDADKSEAQKAADKAAEAEKRAQEAEMRALRLEVAAEKNLTPAQAKRLAGTTKEELEADADELLESFKPAESSEGDDKSKTGPGGRPKERLKPGAGPDDDPEVNPDELAKKILSDSRGY